MLVPYPVTLVMFTEIILNAQGHSRMCMFGVLNALLNLMLKFSNVSKYEKVGIKTLTTLYIVLRLVVLSF